MGLSSFKFSWCEWPFKVIQGRGFWYQSKAPMRLPIGHGKPCGTSTLQTDGQIDGGTTYDRNTALALRASHGENFIGESVELTC